MNSKLFIHTQCSLKVSKVFEAVEIGGAEVVADGHVAAVEREVEAVGALQVEAPGRKVVEYL